MVKTLNEIYELYLDENSDINELLPILKKYAEECSHITEFGTRDGISTIAFLMARPYKLITYDINRSQQINELEKLSKVNFIDFNFIEKNVLETEISETDLLFIDTIHTYEQLFSELNKHASKVKKFIIIHDTTTFGLKDANYTNSDKQGLITAITDFIKIHFEWKIKEIFVNCNGLTILERIKNRE